MSDTIPTTEAVVHDLKCTPKFFEEVMAGRKPFEIRYNDPDYAVGHKLRLREWTDDFKGYSGREVTKTVGYMTDFQQQRGYVVMGFAPEPGEQPGSTFQDAWQRLYSAVSHSIPKGAEGGTCLEMALTEVARLQAQMAAKPAEQRLAEDGVFKGHQGLRGLLEAQEFWDRQSYGTRLYYGDGGADYLHRDVLRSAVRILDGSTPTKGDQP